MKLLFVPNGLRASAFALLLASALAPAAAADLLVERGTYDAGAKVRCSATVADLEGDHQPDIVVVTEDGQVAALRADATVRWMTGGLGKMTVPAAVADLLPSPGLEVIAADYDGFVWCLDAQGSVLWRTRVGEQVNWSAPAISLPARARAHAGGADPSAFIAVGDHTTGMNALSPRGEILWQFAVPGGVACPPAVGDVDGDGAPEIVFGGSDGWIRCLGRDGKEKWAFKTGAAAYTGPVLADLEGDGAVEVVTASGDGSIYVLAGATGDLVWKFDSGAAVDSSVAVADLMPEPGLEVLFANDDGVMHCLSARGEKLCGHLGTRGVW